MRRRLPVLQPTALERRWFLVGIASALAGCASEATSTPRRGTSSSGGTSSGGTSSGGTTPDGGGTLADGAVVDPPPDQPLPDGGGAAPIPDSGTPSQGCAAAGIDVGPPSSFAMGTVKYVSAAGCLIGRDANGLYAMYALCTHTIGNLNIGATQITCTVHGATFTLTGDVTKGPATQPLPHFDMCLNAKGNVAVDVKTIVSSATRLKA